jgi:hypothetical protein
MRPSEHPLPGRRYSQTQRDWNGIASQMTGIMVLTIQMLLMIPEIDEQVGCVSKN